MSATFLKVMNIWGRMYPVVRGVLKDILEGNDCVAYQVSIPVGNGDNLILQLRGLLIQEASTIAWEHVPIDFKDVSLSQALKPRDDHPGFQPSPMERGGSLRPAQQSRDVETGLLQPLKQVLSGPIGSGPSISGTRFDVGVRDAD